MIAAQDKRRPSGARTAAFRQRGAHPGLVSLLDVFEPRHRVEAGLSVDAGMAILAKQNEILVVVPLRHSKFGRGARTGIGGAGDVRDLADDHDGIVVRGFGEHLDAAFRHGASPGRPAPKELEGSVRVAARGSRARLGGSAHGREPPRRSIIGDGSISAMAALSAATPKG